MKLFRRLFVTHMAVAGVALFVSSLAVGYLFYDANGRHRTQRLIAYGEEISQQIRGRPWDAESLPLIAPITDILFKSEATRVRLVSSQELRAMVAQPATNDTTLDLAELQGLLRGERVADANSLHPLLPSPMVAIPVLGGGTVHGAVIMRPSRAVASLARFRIVLFLVVSSALSVAVASWISFWLSRRMAQPIMAIGEAASRLSQGDFESRVPPQAAQEIQQLAESFNQMAMELERLERARKDLVANVSHELKGPLARLIGFVEAIHDGMGGPEAQARYLDTVRRELQRLSRLVNDLLDFAQMETGRFKLHLYPFDVAPHLRRAADVFEVPARAAGIHLHLELPLTLPLLECDIGRVEQALANLLQNAIANTPAGGHVTVRAALEPDAIWVEVADTGRGIPAQHLDLIWERFYKIDRVRTPDQAGGSGLGLAIVKQLVDLHGGEVFVSSHVGVGSTFGFRLPLVGSRSHSA